MRVLASSLLLGLLGALPATAHYVRLDAELVEADAFTVGIALSGRPFAYREDGRVLGFEVEMAKGIADSHGLRLVVRQLPRGELLGALRRGEVDAVNTLPVAAGDATEPTIPYLVVGDHAMVLRGNPFRVRTPDDLSGRTVSATAGSSAESFARDLNERLIGAGREPMQIHTFPLQRDAHFPVSMGHAAAYFVQSVSAVGITQDAESRTRLVEGIFSPSREVGFAVLAGNENIRHAVEHAVAAMVATGKYDRLREAHGLPAELSPFR